MDDANLNVANLTEANLEHVSLERVIANASAICPNETLGAKPEWSNGNGNDHGLTVISGESLGENHLEAHFYLDFRLLLTIGPTI